MMSEGSMKGSGIFSEDITLSVDCEECGHVWDEDLVTDDWGAISNKVVCPSCKYEFTYERNASDYNEDPDQDWLFDK